MRLLRYLIITLATLGALLAPTPSANAAEHVAAYVSVGSATQTVTSPYAQNYRDTYYDNTYCSYKLNLVMKAAFTVRNVTTSSAYISSVKLTFRSAWPVSAGATSISGVTVRTGRNELPVNTYTTITIPVGRTFSFNSSRQITLHQWYQFLDVDRFPELCGVNRPRTLAVSLVRR